LPDAGCSPVAPSEGGAITDSSILYFTETPMATKRARAASFPDAASTGDFGAPEPDPLVIAIQVQAYEIFLSRGERHGDDLADWLEAERIVRADLGLPNEW
jgi:hypothetical protein